MLLHPGNVAARRSCTIHNQPEIQTNSHGREPSLIECRRASVSSLLRQPVTLQKATARGTRSRCLLLVKYFCYTSSRLSLCTVAYHSHIGTALKVTPSPSGSDQPRSQVSALPSTKRPCGASSELSGSVAHEADACSINGPHRNASEVACTRLASSGSEVANRSSA